MMTAVQILLAYLLGSVSGSLVLGAVRHVDIRQSGSGNAGGTNAFRTQGFRFALGVVVIDVGKGIIAAALLPRLEMAGFSAAFEFPTQAALCGFAAMLGHCFPIWHGFKGGKGAATAIGVICVIQPLAILPMLLVWFTVLILTGWVGLSTMVAGVSLVPVFLWLGASGPLVVFAVLTALFLMFTHRNNILKMREGREYRFEKIMLRNWIR